MSYVCRVVSGHREEQGHFFSFWFRGWHFKGWQIFTHSHWPVCQEPVWTAFNSWSSLSVDSFICSCWNETERFSNSTSLTVLLIPESPWTSCFSLEKTLAWLEVALSCINTWAEAHFSWQRTNCHLVLQHLQSFGTSKTEVSEDRQFIHSIVYKMHNLFLYIHLHLVHTQLLNIFPKNRNMTHFHNFWIIEVFSKTENIASF